jgi:hypothetical protein|tara:strand:+ start:331 stop:525 length:195 start_codon:yes stop_codon:yes gene_type:complete
MDSVALAQKLLKNIREQRQLMSDHLSDGGASTMEDYRFVVGQMRGLTYAEEEIKATMKGIEEDE